MPNSRHEWRHDGLAELAPGHAWSPLQNKVLMVQLKHEVLPPSVGSRDLTASRAAGDHERRG